MAPLCRSQKIHYFLKVTMTSVERCDDEGTNDTPCSFIVRNLPNGDAGPLPVFGLWLSIAPGTVLQIPETLPPCGHPCTVFTFQLPQCQHRRWTEPLLSHKINFPPAMLHGDRIPERVLVADVEMRCLALLPSGWSTWFPVASALRPPSPQAPTSSKNEHDEDPSAGPLPSLLTGDSYHRTLYLETHHWPGRTFLRLALRWRLFLQNTPSSPASFPGTTPVSRRKELPL